MYVVAGRAAKVLFYRNFKDLASTNIEEITNTFCGKLRKKFANGRPIFSMFVNI